MKRLRDAVIPIADIEGAAEDVHGFRPRDVLRGRFSDMAGLGEFLGKTQVSEGGLVRVSAYLL